MEKSKAFQDLLNATDLLSMIEELIHPSYSSRLTPAVLSGIRMTLRATRESIGSSHDTLSELMNSSESVGQSRTYIPLSSKIEKEVDGQMSNAQDASLSDVQKLIQRRRDLQDSLKKVVQRVEE